MTTSVSFCLSYDPLKWDDIISIRKGIVDMDVVNDITSMRQCYYMCVHTIFVTGRFPLYNSDVM